MDAETTNKPVDEGEIHGLFLAGLELTGEPMVLDHLEPLTVSPERVITAQQHFDAIDRMMFGMMYCYEGMRLQEQRAAAALSFSGGEMQMWGQVPGVRMHLVNNLFDWYSVNACRFFKLRGFLSDQVQAKPDKYGAASEYVKRVCGPVSTYRDKIGAHFIEGAPLKGDSFHSAGDNKADATVSTLSPAAFVNGRFLVGAFTITRRDAGKTETSKHDLRWSLTQFHEEVVFSRVGTMAPKTKPSVTTA